jgi:hypothetical protein
VVHGYKFERGQDLFKGIVEHFYEIKRNNKAIGEIAKITLNSLYGRLGMQPLRQLTEIVTQDKHDELALKFKTLDCQDIGNGYELVTYE